jgi:anti-sigma regulatory factor (Ser/Thr protein kinase)
MQSLAEADPACQERHVTLPANAQSAGFARTAVRRTLAYWGMTDITDDAVMLVSELVGNALAHACSEVPDTGQEPLTLSLTNCVKVLRIEVCDPDPSPPEPRVPGAGDESGFGLVIVASLASAWGARQVGQGKAVWAELPTTPADW